MNCYYHPNVEAQATCISCGRAICNSCAVNVAGRIACQNCVAGGKLAPSNKPTNSLAIVSLVLGVLSICMGGIFFSVPAWILGNMAQKQLQENPNEEGAQLANIGRILGMIITILYTVVIAVYLLLVIFTLIASMFQQ